MATVVKDLGVVTAYAYAVAGGYTGTEDEFEELLGNIATDLAEIENLTVTVTTLPAGSAATASYSDGVLALGIPTGDKGDTGTAATIAVGTVTTVAPTANAEVTNTGTSAAAVFTFKLPRGDGVATVTKTGTSGNVDTYTMTSDRGVTLGTFTVTNSNVSSVNGETGTVVLDAGDIAYDGTETYASGSTGEALTQLKSEIGGITDEIESISLTPNASQTNAGVTCAADTENDVLKVYGTCTAQRRFLCYNGQNAIKNSSSSFSKTLDAGTYLIESDVSGSSTKYRVDATYTTFANGFVLVNDEVKTKIITFTAPVMIGFSSTLNRDYGTSESPTYFSFSAKLLSADDIVARSAATAAINKIDRSNLKGVFNFENVPTAEMTTFGLSPANNWTVDADQRSYVFRIPKNVTKFRVTAHDTETSIVAFLASYAPVEAAAADMSEEYSNRIALSAGTYADFDVSGTMRYLFCLVKNSSGTDCAPTLEIYCSDTILQSVDEETADESSVTDRKSEIFTMLNAFGECRLAKGVFYTSASIYMPVGSKLIGSGKESVVKLTAATESGSAIVMGPSCTVRDLTVKGDTSSQWGLDVQGTRYGIEWTGEEQLCGVVDNCRVLNFTGAGIYLHDTTQKTYRNLAISSCYIHGNYIGIDIRKNSEFNRISNCTVIGNKIGFRNRGGNNMAVNCGFDANKTGILVDADEGSNNGHGFITGCMADHSNSGNGYGLIIRDTGRMLVTNCEFFYSKILIDNSNGNVISNCGFGTGSAWEIEDGECSLIIGCMVRGWDDGTNTDVTITNNTAVKIINCFDRSGNPYSA